MTSPRVLDLRTQLAAVVCCCLVSAALLGACPTQAQIYPQVATPGSASAAGAAPWDNGLKALSQQESTAQPVEPLTTTSDLWERIRRGYAMPDLDSPLVHDREAWYAARPDYISRMSERSRKYLFHIVEELELRNMPTELALLPFVESAFNPQAVSSAKAAGMWQFMPATGRTFELKQNVFRDDRRDVLASTRAALDYLQKLYRLFGDWHLALAAYNWGEGSVGRAISKNERLLRGTGYTDLTMPMETQLYVPKLQAIKNIVGNPQAFGSALPQIGNHPYFQPVTIRRDMDVTMAAKLAEVPLEDFKALNPSLSKPVILAAGTPQILLPWDSAGVFQQNLDRMGDTRLASWTAWVAPSTLRVADAARQVGMGEAQLREVNNIPKGMLIKPGSTLLVPRAAYGERDVTEAIADRGEVNFAPEVVAQVRKTVRAAKGDSVASIAKRFSTTANNVAQWNKVPANAHFKTGQTVVLYVPGKIAITRTAGAVRSSPHDKAHPPAKKIRPAAVKKSKA